MAAYPRFKADTKTCSQSKYERRGTEQDRIDACERLREYGGSLPQYDDAVFQVEERTGYGLRPVEVTRKDCRVLSWSNAAQNWAAYAMREKKGTSTLDSNHIMVCGLGQDRANALALALPPLPLYGGSTEARERRGRGRGGVNGLGAQGMDRKFQKWLQEIDNHMQEHGMGYENAVRSGDGDEAIEKVWKDLYRRRAKPMDAIEKVFGQGYGGSTEARERRGRGRGGVNGL